MTDPSSTLSQNLEALGFEPHALSLEPQAGWRVEWTEPWPNLSIETEPGKWVALSSRRAPMEEARAQLDELRGGQPWLPLVVLIGAGLGYAIDVIEADAPPETKVLVIEPFAPSAAALLARRDWTPLVDAGRLGLIVGPKFSGASDAWRWVDARRVPPLVVPSAVLERVRPDAVAAARRILDRASFDASANAEARETLGGRYLVNTLRNLPRILAGPDLRTWAGTKKGQPVVVCGAGPSLNRNLHDLRPYRDGVVLIAVDTALRPILESGLEPDLVVALDPSPLNARHLSGLRLPERTWLVSEAALDPAAFDSFGDHVAFFRVGDNDPWPWLGEHGVDVPVLAAWGSVLTSAFALAEWLGADPLLLMGADLAYTNNQPYCRGTTFEVDWARVVLEGQPLPKYWARQAARRATEHLTGLDGVAVDSAPHLIAFRDWLTDRAAKSGRRVINLTGAGILAGAEQGRLTNVFGVGPVPLITESTKSGHISRALATSYTVRASLFDTLASLRDDQPPLADWISSYARSLDRAMLDLALAEVASGIADPNGRPSDARDAGTKLPASARALIALPESVAIIRAARDGGGFPIWANESPAWDLRETQHEPSASFRSLMQMPLGVVDASGDQMNATSGCLHLLYDLEWPQTTLEAVTAMVIDSAAQLLATPPGTSLRQRARPTPPAPETTAPLVTSPRRADRRAQTFVTSVWATGIAARETTADPAWRSLLDTLDAANVTLDQRPTAPDARVRVTVTDERHPSSRPWRTVAPLTTARLVETMRGSLLGAPFDRPHIKRSADGICLDVEWHTKSVDSDVLHREFTAAVPHRVLTDEGLPKCLMASAHPEGGAIVTPRGQHASFRVDVSGAFEPMADWPSPIVGEVHAPHGAVAWTFTSPTSLLFRETPSSCRRLRTRAVPDVLGHLVAESSAVDRRHGRVDVAAGRDATPRRAASARRDCRHPRRRAESRSDSARRRPAWPCSHDHRLGPRCRHRPRQRSDIGRAWAGLVRDAWRRSLVNHLSAGGRPAADAGQRTGAMARVAEPAHGDLDGSLAVVEQHRWHSRRIS